MTTSAAEVAGLVRLTLVGPERRADLAVPAAVPVADLLPDLARAVAVLDPYLVHGGYRLVTEGGQLVASAVGLAAQGIDDGSVLTLEVGAHDRQDPAYDDVVEAVADVVENSTRPWDAAASRRTALAAAVLLLGSAVVALGLERTQGAPVAAAAAVLAVLLLAGAAVLARTQRAPEAAAVVAWLAVPFAVVAGLAAASSHPLSGLPLALAGFAGLAASLVAMVGLLQHRAALLPAVVVTGAAGVAGAVVEETTFALPAVAAVVLVVVGLATGAAPVVAMSLTRVRVPQPRGDLDPTVAEPQPGIGADDVRRGIGLGREVLVGLSAAAALLLALCAPLLPRLGVSGALLGVAAAALLMLRTRRTRAWVDVTLGLGGGLVGLVLVFGATALVHPGWRTVLAVAAVATGIVLLLVSASPRPRQLWVGRLGDVAEVVVLVVLVPLLVLAIGLVAAVRT